MSTIMTALWLQCITLPITESYHFQMQVSNLWTYIKHKISIKLTQKSKQKCFLLKQKIFICFLIYLYISQCDYLFKLWTDLSFPWGIGTLGTGLLSRDSLSCRGSSADVTGTEPAATMRSGDRAAAMKISHLLIMSASKPLPTPSKNNNSIV